MQHEAKLCQYGSWAGLLERINVPVVQYPLWAPYTQQLYPVINYEANLIEDPYLRNEDELSNHVAEDMDDIVIKKAVVDDMVVPAYRIKSDPIVFDVSIDKTNPKEIPPGVTRMASDGYWVFLKTLTYGKHTISFHGACAGGRRNSTASYEISII
jgi:hypothetical protein